MDNLTLAARGSGSSRGRRRETAHGAPRRRRTAREGGAAPAPALGRPAAARRDRAGAHDVAEGHALRRGHLGLDPELVGEVLVVMRDLARGHAGRRCSSSRTRCSSPEVGDRLVFMDNGKHRGRGPSSRRARQTRRSGQGASCAGPPARPFSRRPDSHRSGRSRWNEEDRSGHGRVAVLAIAASLGAAQPTATTASARADARRRRCRRSCPPRSPIAAPDRQGVKCDTPPFGYLDVGARTPASTSRSRSSCPLRVRPRSAADVRVRSDGGREPLLTTGRVDLSSRRSRTRPIATRGSTSRGRTTRRRDGCSSRPTPRSRRSTTSGASVSRRRAARSTTAG